MVEKPSILTRICGWSWLLRKKQLNSSSKMIRKALIMVQYNLQFHFELFMTTTQSRSICPNFFRRPWNSSSWQNAALLNPSTVRTSSPRWKGLMLSALRSMKSSTWKAWNPQKCFGTTLAKLRSGSPDGDRNGFFSDGPTLGTRHQICILYLCL